MNVALIILDFLKQHWWKVALVGIFLIIVFKKEVSFGIHFKSPYRPERQKEQTQPVPVKQVEKRDGYFTEDVASAKKQASLIDRFSNFPKIGRRKVSALRGVNQAEIDAFLNRFMPIAQAEHEKYNIPISIILANALLQSKAGTNPLAQAQYNYFALPCSANWKGTLHWQNGNCYRQYEKAWTSFRDHSLYLTTGPNVNLLQLGNDYKAWAKAIEALDYSPIPRLANQLIEVIQKLNLQQLDVE